MRAVAQSGERLYLATPDHRAANSSEHERPGRREAVDDDRAPGSTSHAHPA